MSRKHHVKKDRSPSRYKERLAARGLSASPRMKWSHCAGAMSQQEIARALEVERNRQPRRHGDVAQTAAVA